MGCLATLLDRGIVNVAGDRVLEVVVQTGDGIAGTGTGAGIRAGGGEVVGATAVGTSTGAVVG